MRYPLGTWTFANPRDMWQGIELVKTPEEVDEALNQAMAILEINPSQEKIEVNYVTLANILKATALMMHEDPDVEEH